MKVVTTRLEEKDSRELAEIEKAEKSDRSVVVRKLLEMGMREWKMRNAVRKLRNREVSISKAAEIAGVTYSDMLDVMAGENIEIGYTANDLEKDFARIRKK